MGAKTVQLSSNSLMMMMVPEGGGSEEKVARGATVVFKTRAQPPGGWEQKYGNVFGMSYDVDNLYTFT